MRRHTAVTRITDGQSPWRVAAIGIAALASLCVLPGTLGAQAPATRSMSATSRSVATLR